MFWRNIASIFRVKEQAKQETIMKQEQSKLAKPTQGTIPHSWKD
jgi:hypothetical protein